MKRSLQRPFQLLLQIEEKGRVRVTKFPQQEGFKEKWSGIPFELNGHMLLTPMKEVSEVMSIRSVTRIPGVKPWVLGIANQRGNLLPIMDLQLLLFNKKYQFRAGINQQRIIVVNHLSIPAGILVDNVWSIKHFGMDERSKKIPDLPFEFLSFVTSSFIRDKNHYGVFSFVSLVESKKFLEIAA
jgi:twitching motility protein PilI